MRLLLDTHIFLWAIGDDARLPETARELVLDGGNHVSVSVVSLWEVAIKHRRHPDLMLVGADDLVHYAEGAGYARLPLLERHVLALGDLRQVPGSPRHEDPFDRMLLAQAKADGLLLVTHDRRLGTYGEACVRLV